MTYVSEEYWGSLSPQEQQAFRSQSATPIEITSPQGQVVSTEGTLPYGSVPIPQTPAFGGTETPAFGGTETPKFEPTEGYNSIMLDPKTGKVAEAKSRSQFKYLQQQGFLSSPSFEQLKEIGAIGVDREDWESDVVASVAAQNLPMIKGEDGQEFYDIEQIVETYGVEKSKEIMAKVLKDTEKVDKYIDALGELKEFKSDSGYDIVDALTKGIPVETLQDAGYSETDIDEAVLTADARKELAEYVDARGDVDIDAALAVGVPLDTIKRAGYSITGQTLESRQEEIQTYPNEYIMQLKTGGSAGLKAYIQSINDERADAIEKLKTITEPIEMSQLPPIVSDMFRDEKGNPLSDDVVVTGYDEENGLSYYKIVETPDDMLVEQPGTSQDTTVTDPETGMEVSANWINEFKTDTNDPIDIIEEVSRNSGASREESEAALREIFATGGLKGVEDHINNVRGTIAEAKEKELEPYEEEYEVPLTGTQEYGIRFDESGEPIPETETKTGYRVDELAKSLLSEGNSEDTTINKIIEYGFTPEVAKETVQSLALAQRKEGAEQFEQAMADADFREHNVEVGPNRWVEKGYFEDLSDNKKSLMTKAYNTIIPDRLSFSKESPLPDITKDQSLALAYLPFDEAKQFFMQMDEDAKYQFLIDRNIKPSEASKFELLPEEKQKEIVQTWQTIVNRAYNPKSWREAVEGAFIPLIPVVGTYVTVKDRGIKSGWTIVSALGDLTLVAGPMLKAVGVVGKTTAIDAAVAKNAQEFSKVGKAIESVAGPKVANEIVSSNNAWAKATAEHIADLAAIDRERERLIDTITASRLVTKTGEREIEPTAKLLSTTEIGQTERSLAEIPSSDIKLVVSDYDKAILKAQTSAEKLAKASAEYNKIIEKYSKGGEIGNFKTTELVRYGESPSITRVNIKGGYVKPAIVTDDPLVLEAMKKSAANAVDNTKAAYEAIVRPKVYDVARIDETLADLKVFLTKYGSGLNDRSLNDILNEVNRLEAMRYEGLVQRAGQSVKDLPVSVDQVGQMQKQIANVDRIISIMKTTGASDDAIKGAQITKNQLQSLFAEMIEKGTRPIYEASKVGKGTELTVTSMGDMYSKALVLDRLLSPSYLKELALVNQLPESQTKLLTGLKEALLSGDNAGVLSSLDQIENEVKLIKPTEPIKPTDTEWQSYLDKFRTYKKDVENVTKQSQYIRENVTQVKELSGVRSVLDNPSALKYTSLLDAAKDKELQSLREALIKPVNKKTLVQVLDKDPLKEARLAELEKLLNTPVITEAKVVSGMQTITIAKPTGEQTIVRAAFPSATEMVGLKGISKTDTGVRSDVSTIISPETTGISEYTAPYEEAMELVSPATSPILEPTPMPEPTEYTYPTPIEEVYPYPKPEYKYPTPPKIDEPPKTDEPPKGDERKPIINPPSAMAQKVEKEILRSKGAIALYQGRIKQGTDLKELWYVIKFPYKSEKDAFRLIGQLPKGVTPVMKGQGASVRSIQVLTGIPPAKLSLDLGLQDIHITSGRGKKLNVSYKKDRRRTKRGDIDLRKVSTVRL